MSQGEILEDDILVSAAGQADRPQKHDGRFEYGSILL
jgi:hypothetical protein